MARSNVNVFSGNGVPGAASGPKGSLYLRKDGGTNTTLYVRQAAGAIVAASASLDGITIANGDTVTIGAQTYTFKTALTAPAVPNEVKVGASDSISLDNLIAAINAAAGSGSTYGTGTVANADVTAAAGAGDTMDIAAKLSGAAGNGIALSATLTSGSWNRTTTEGGVYDDGTGWVAK